MTRKIVTGTYTFCTNSNYYEAFVKYVKDKSCDVEKKDSCEGEKKDSCEREKKDSCEVGTKDSCDELSTSMMFSNNLRGKYICQEFKLLYKLLRDNSEGEPTEKIKHKDADFFSKHRNIDNHFYNINPEILENMKILYELYHTKQKILDIMIKQDDSSSEMYKCPDYIEICQKKYKEGLDKCHSAYDDFYKALKLFQMDYIYGIEKETDKSGQCKSISFLQLPEYDPVVEKHRNIMAGKILSAPLILSFVIPLLYKYTPLGPFLRTKINMIKNNWMNSDEYGSELSSLPTDIEDNISDNGEYNIGYYSGTN
ncbi:PIR Superfamily Protein [Plasmodium ovale curtisi]|uniref:PIR Superfamily Protein n=2 Tax=Plasmodium ovale curtisi TaxID=864141 RepID=A0A1A8X5S7_PLAOA|nr:PIR Superfamily Protein [Plasmodium ovale curtisi]